MSSPLHSVTGRRLLAAFAIVLVLFGAALAVELVTLHRIAESEAAVTRLNEAEHAGHTVAAEVRDQYIHQAHTLIEFGKGHLPHYAKVVVAARQAIVRLGTLVDTEHDHALVDQVAALAAANDRDFWAKVVPAIERGDRSDIAKLGNELEAVVDQVVALVAELTTGLETRARGAQQRAAALRSRAMRWTIVCFALAILVAAGIGLWLARAIARRVGRLRDGARRVGAGDLAARIELDGDDELSELATSFNQMAASLAAEQAALVRAQKLASIGHVAAGVAHELNNPLSVILGYAKLLRAEPGPRSDELEIIEDEARQCQRIVQELLELARPHQLEIEPVDLAELAREAIDRLEDAGMLGARAVEIVASAPVMVPGDAGRLRQVIANVVVNAAEATGPAGKITIEARAEADGASLTISDDGPGIANDVADRMFEPFVTTKANGTGLGLAIAQAIVDAHGGRIAVGSSPGEGTHVSLQLPGTPRAEVTP